MRYVLSCCLQRGSVLEHLLPSILLSICPSRYPPGGQRAASLPLKRGSRTGRVLIPSHTTTTTLHFLSASKHSFKPSNPQSLRQALNSLAAHPQSSLLLSLLFLPPAAVSLPAAETSRSLDCVCCAPPASSSPPFCMICFCRSCSSAIIQSSRPLPPACSLWVMIAPRTIIV